MGWTTILRCSYIKLKGLDPLKNGDSSYGVYLNKGKTSSVSGAVAKEFAKLGFVILGQTNYPEFGTRNITDSKLFGPAGNPWILVVTLEDLQEEVLEL